MKNKLLAVFLFIIVLGFIFMYGFSRHEEIVEAEMTDDELNISNSNFIKEEKVQGSNYVELITVDVKGAVKNPGVYEIEENKRVVDVIEKAGGTNENANTNYINLSTKLKDEMVIWVYTNDEIKKLELEKSSVQYMIKECNCPTVSNSTCINNNENNSNNKGEKNNIININSAKIDELSSLPGIGESKAKAIIEYREKNGSFKSVEDIMNVSGIGEALFKKIKANIKV